MIEELSASRRKLIASLRRPKNRREEGLFVIEGSKCVLDTARLFDCRMIVATHSWIDSNPCRDFNAPVYKATTADMERMSSLSTAPEVMAVCRIPVRELDMSALSSRLVVALDGVQDPGNLGTIIRACDWFGVTTVLCSRDTVDLYNPKVIQSTMGAVARVSVHYVDLPDLLAGLDASAEGGDANGVRLYGTFLDGDDIYHADLSPSGIIVMGNEGKGVSAEVGRLVNHRLYIPSYPPGAEHVESLNVSMATSIILAEFRRRSSSL